MKRGSAGGKKMALIQKEQARHRIDEYNKNPNICRFCGKPILAPYNKKLNETKRKIYCSQSCAAKFNNVGNKRNIMGKGGVIPLIERKTDNEIIDAFYNSNSISEFGKNLGYKYKIRRSKSVCNKLSSLGLDINDIDATPTKTILNSTKGEVFAKYNNWTQSRVAIQREAKIIYKKSNKPKRCVVCGYNKHYEVAHIKSVSSFNDDILVSEIDNIDNLISLCPNHHWEYDNNKLNIQPYLDKIN